MATVFRTDTCYVVIRAVRIGRITMIVVFCNHVVSAFFFRKRELALSVGYPQTEFVAAQRLA